MSQLNDFLSCGTPELTTLPVDGLCVALAAPRLSQIKAVLILPKPLKPPSDWTSKSDIEDIVDNTDGTNTKGKWITGFGELPEPEDITTTLGRVHKIICRRKYTLLLNGVLSCEENYTFLQILQTNWTGWRFWFYTVGGRIIGGENGIKPSFVSPKFSYGSDSGAIESSSLRIEWDADSAANRAYVPGVFSDTILSSGEQPETPTTYPEAYENDTAALAGGVNNCTFYRLTQVNSYDAVSPGGRGLYMSKIASGCVSYVSESAAEIGGVAIGEVYAAATTNIYGLPSAGGRMALVRTDGGAITTFKGPFRNDSEADNGGVLIGEPYLAATDNYYGYPSAGGRTLLVRIT